MSVLVKDLSKFYLFNGSNKLGETSGADIKKIAKLIKDKQIAAALNLPPIKLHCSVLAEGSIKAAIEDWEHKVAHRKHNQ